MTDKEIIKALECCQTQYARNCKDCPYERYQTHYISTTTCSSQMRKDLLDLINRYEAEIERLKGDLPMFVVSSSDVPLIDLLKNTKVINATSTDASIEIIPSKKTIRAEAIKEFAERLKASTCEFGSAKGIQREIDNLVKEMTEGDTDG